MKITREEQETLLSYDPISDEWTFYSSVPSHIRSFIRNPILDKEKIEVITKYDGKPTSISFTVESSFVTKSFIKKKRTISEEHKQALLAGKMKASSL